MDIEQTKEKLSARLEELLDRLEHLKADAARSHSSDFSEMAQERENDEVVDALGNESREEIRQIQGALLRIDQETYGKCQECGETIAEARLAALPSTAYCANCMS
jgi:RNA polymerase-binding transcription factor DksA